MPTLSFRRKVVLLLVATTLIAPWSLGAASRRDAPPRHSVAPAPAPLPLLGGLWSLLTGVWNGNLGLPGHGTTSSESGIATPMDTGCHLDPDGCSGSRTCLNPTGEGCQI